MLPEISSVAIWASNASRDGYYASNIHKTFEAQLSNAMSKATSAFMTATTSAGLSAWASNACGRVQNDGKLALVQIDAIDRKTRDLSNIASMASFNASNAISAARGIADVVSATNTGLSNARTSATYGCNIARLALGTSYAVSNAAFPASILALEASSNAKSALVRAADGVSASLGGQVNGTLDFANRASLIHIASVGVGTAMPEYPIHVSSIAPNSTISMWLSGDIHTLSDSRDKERLSRIDGALDRLLSISGYTYFRCGESKRSAGVLAQEVIDVLPEAVHVDSNTGKMSVSYNSIIPLIIEAIRELAKCL
jgi:hypothetical protein